MGLVWKLKKTLEDLGRGGPRYLIGGLRAKLSRAERIVVTLPHAGSVHVRPGQSDFATLRQVFRDSEYRLPERRSADVDREYRRLLDAGRVPVIVDAGANIGAASLWFKRRFPLAAIVSIEPDSANAAMARRNLSGLSDVSVIEAAIGGAEGFASVSSAVRAWSITTERAMTGCAIITVDQAVGTVTNGSLFIAKVDIEGFESDLFSGDLRWLDDAYVVYVEPHDWMFPGGGTSRNFQAAFGEREFEIHLQGENLVYIRR